MWFQTTLRVEAGKPRFMHAWYGQAVPPKPGITHLYKVAARLKKNMNNRSGESLDFAVGKPWLGAWLCDPRNISLSLSLCYPSKILSESQVQLRIK